MRLDRSFAHRVVVRATTFAQALSSFSHALHDDVGLPTGLRLLSLLVLLECLDEIVPIEDIQRIGCICWHISYGVLGLLVFCHIKLPEVSVGKAFWRLRRWLNLLPLDRPRVPWVFFDQQIVGCE